MPTLPGLDKGVFKDPAPPAVDSVTAPITIPNGTTLVTTKTTNETIDNVNQLIDYISGDNGPNFIPQLAIDSLVVDLAARELLVNKVTTIGTPGNDTNYGTEKAIRDALDLKEDSLGFTPEDIANKGAVSGYAGLDASQELLLANFPTGSSLQVLRRNAGNNALEFADAAAGGGITSINADTTAAQIIAAGTGLGIVDAGATHTLSIDSTVVTLTGVQVLTNKTLTTPTIGNFTNATHDHEDAAGGGQLVATAISNFDTAVSANSDVTANTAKISYTDAAAVALNTAKVTNATHTGDVTGATALTLQSVSITGQTPKATPVAADEILISDSADSGNLKKITLTDLLGGGGEANTISSLGGGTVLTAAVPKSGVNLQTVSIATTAPIAHIVVTDLLTFSLDPLVNADIATGAAIDVAKLADGNPGQFIRTDAAGTGVEYADDIASITFIIDGGGTVLSTGLHGDLEIPFNCTIERVTLLADQTGSVEIDLFVDTFANYPPVIGDSIVAASPPTITADDNSQDATLSFWTTTLASGSTIRYNVNSVATIERVTIALLVRKTG